MISVTITDKDGSSSVQQFDKSEILIGRVKGNDVVLPKTNVSKRHSRIIVKDGRAILVDLKSTNGTFVNGQKITAPRPLAEGDKVFIGDFTLEVKEIASSGGAAPAGVPSAAPMPSFGQLPGVNGGMPAPHVEAARPLGVGGTPSLNGLPSLGGQPTIGSMPPVGGLPSLGAPVATAPMGPGASPSPSIPSMSGAYGAWF